MISPRIDTSARERGLQLRQRSRRRQARTPDQRYYQNLGEGSFDEFPPPMVETGSKNYLTIALEEVAAGKLKYHYR